MQTPTKEPKPLPLPHGSTLTPKKLARLIAEQDKQDEQTRKDALNKRNLFLHPPH
jgi:hypothetical protein